MHRASTRQADLDARILRQRRIGRLLLGAPETYTALADRPGRALLGGAVASLVVVMVVGVVAAAGSARTARRADGQARQPPGAAALAAATPTTTPKGTGAGPTTGGGPGTGTGTGTGAGAGGGFGAPGGQDQGVLDHGGQDPEQDPGGQLADGRGSGGLPVVVSVQPSAGPACLAGEDGIEVVPLFTEDGVLGRVELSGFAEGCVGRDVRVAVLGPDGAELDSRPFVLGGVGPLSVTWRERPLRRDALGRIVVEVG